MPIEKYLLNQTVQRERPPATPTLSRLGGTVRSFPDIQELRALIQPMRGDEKFGEAGRVETDVFLMFYNPVQYSTDFDTCCAGVDGVLFNPICREEVFLAAGSLATGTYASDVTTEDRIRDAQGLTYRVDWAVDADGTGDHFEARLVRIRTGAESGAATDK